MADSNTLRTATTAVAIVVLLSSCGGSPEPGNDLATGDTRSQPSRAEVALAHIDLTQAELDVIGLETVPAGTRRLTSQLQAMGRILANQHRTAIVSYPFSARVAEIHATIGDWVELGEKLVVLQSEEVGDASAAYYKAIADFELSRLNHERESQLFRRGVGARKNQFASEAGLRVAEANLNAAEKKLHVLGFSEDEIILISESHQVNPVVAVYSPITGKVVENNVVLGEMVDETTEILTIMDPNLLWVDAQIYEKDIARIRPGQDALITVPAYPNDNFSGLITYISDVLDEDTRTITVRTEVPNTDGRLKPGMFANVVISLGSNGEAVALPVNAVLDDRGRQLVFIRTGPRHFEPRHVITGTREGIFVEIVSGVEVGEEVVTSGNFQLKSRLYEALITADHVH